MKKIMAFLFGKKYPIFNKSGEIEHQREDFFKQWRESYIKNPDKDWRNHSGASFKEDKASGD